MTALAEFVRFCYRVFVECVQLTLELIALLFFVGALVMPWRGSLMMYALCARPKDFEGFDTRKKYRETSVVQFLIGLFEGATLLILPIVSLSGLRSAMLFEKAQEAKRNGWSAANLCNFDLLFSIWEQLFSLLADAICFPFLVAALVMPWRWPAVTRGLRRHGSGWLFQTICPWRTPKNKREASGEIRGRWIAQAFLAFCDLVTALPLLVVLCTGLRTRKLLRKLRSESVRAQYEVEAEYNPKAVEVIWKQCASLLVDCLFVPIALLVLLSGWRSLSLLQLLCVCRLRTQVVTQVAALCASRALPTCLLLAAADHATRLRGIPCASSGATPS